MNSDLSTVEHEPKIDLHRHISGSIRWKEAVRLARKYGIDLCARKQSFHQSSSDQLQRSLAGWPSMLPLFRNLDAIVDLVDCVASDAVRDRVVYIELRVGPHGLIGDYSYPFEVFCGCMEQSVRLVEDTYPIKIRCLLGASRPLFARLGETDRLRCYERILAGIMRYPDTFVGVDVNGEETAAPLTSFAPLLTSAKQAGLKVSIHAGETAFPSEEDIELALSVADRIGHGLRLIRDEWILHVLRERRIVLEVCPTSNIWSGVIANFSELPIKELGRRQIKYVIGTDNPAIYGTTLSREMEETARWFEFPRSWFRERSIESLEAAFIGPLAREEIRQNLMTCGRG